jgi:polysaccharide export outer membrane protein
MRNFGFMKLTCAVGCVCVFLISCVQTKSLTYFDNLPDTTLVLDNLQPPRPAIQVNDEIEIQVGGENEKTVEYITHYFTAGANTLKVVVDIDGYIELPKLGKIKVFGLTREAARDTITNAYKEYLVDPIVAIKFGDFRFTVLGEVRSPGTFEVTNEKLSILEALAKAGDLTEYAKPDEVKIIRDLNGKREIIPVNLKDKNLLNSSNYYLNRYDLVYVKPGAAKGINQNIQQSAIYISAVTSLLAIVFLLFRL